MFFFGGGKGNLVGSCRTWMGRYCLISHNSTPVELFNKVISVGRLKQKMVDFLNVYRNMEYDI